MDDAFGWESSSVKQRQNMFLRLTDQDDETISGRNSIRDEKWGQSLDRNYSVSLLRMHHIRFLPITDHYLLFRVDTDGTHIYFSLSSGDESLTNSVCKWTEQRKTTLNVPSKQRYTFKLDEGF